VVPHYAGRVARAEVDVLQETLTLIRDGLDKRYTDTGRYPDALKDLVTKRYLRSNPHDPVTQSNATWIAVAPADRQKGGMHDVRSSARGTGSNGKPHEQW